MTIPNRKKVAIRADFLFLVRGSASGRFWGGGLPNRFALAPAHRNCARRRWGVPDRSLNYGRMLWFRIRVVSSLAHSLIVLVRALNLKFDSLIFSLVLLCLRSAFDVSPIREFALLFGSACGFSYSGALS